jgi:hypothetical protein
MVRLARLKRLNTSPFFSICIFPKEPGSVKELLEREVEIAIAGLIVGVATKRAFLSKRRSRECGRGEESSQEGFLDCPGRWGPKDGMFGTS